MRYENADGSVSLLVISPSSAGRETAHRHIHPYFLRHPHDLPENDLHLNCPIVLRVYKHARSVLAVWIDVKFACSFDAALDCIVG